MAGSSYHRHTVVCYYGETSSPHSEGTLRDESGVNGTAWNVDMRYVNLHSDDYQYGYAKQKIRVDKTKENTTGAFMVGYNHRVLPTGVTVTFKAGIVEFSGFANKTVKILYNIKY